MNISFEAEKIEVTPVSGKRTYIQIEDVDASDVLDNFDIQDVIDHFKEDEILDKIGMDTVMRYFDLKEKE